MAQINVTSMIENFKSIFDQKEFNEKWNELQLDNIPENEITKILVELPDNKITIREILYLSIIHITNYENLYRIIEKICKNFNDFESGKSLYPYLINVNLETKNILKLIDLLEESTIGVKYDIIGILLGAICKKENRYVDRISQMLNSTNSLHVSTALYSVQIGAQFIENKQMIKKIVLEFKLEKLDENAIKELTKAIITLYEENDTKSIDILNDILNRYDYSKFYLSQSLWINQNIPLDLIKLFLMKCANTKNSSTHDEICRVLYKFKNELELNDILNILFIIIDNEKYVHGTTSWILSELGKTQLKEICKYCLERLENMNDENKKYIYQLYLIPDILSESAAEKRLDLTNVLYCWENENIHRKLILAIIKKLIESISLINKKNDENVLIKIKNTLYIIANKEGLNPEKVMKDQQKIILKCGKLLNEINKEKESVNTKKAKENIENFPKIKNLLKTEWIDETESGKRDANELLRLLSQILTDEELNSDNVTFVQKKRHMISSTFLNHIEELLKNIEVNEPSIGDLKNKFWSDEFSVALSELEVVSRLRIKYQVELYPEVKRNVDGIEKKSKLDAQINISENNILVEVITPQMMPELKYIGFSSVPNRLASKIYSEFTEQIKGLQDNRNIIMIVDKSNSEIGYYEANQYMKGPTAFFWSVNTSTQEIGDTYVGIKEDGAMGKLEPEMNLILGILVYDRIKDKKNRLHLRGRFIPNMYNPKIDEMIEIIDNIKSCFLG